MLNFRIHPFTFSKTPLHQIVDSQSVLLKNAAGETLVPIPADHSRLTKLPHEGRHRNLIVNNILSLLQKVSAAPPPFIAEGFPPLVLSPSKPKLRIHRAMWCDMDITSNLSWHITPEQTLKIDATRDIDVGDPWWCVQKTISILYSYENEPLKLMVTHDGAAKFWIHPGRQMPSYMNPKVNLYDKGYGESVYLCD